MKSAKEMIIEVKQGLQRQNANKVDSQFDDEIIWALNQVQDSYIQQHVKRRDPRIPVYEIDMHGYTALSPLVTTFSRPTNQIVKGVSSCQLPPLSRYLLSVGAYSKNNCNNSEVDITEEGKEYIGTYELKKSTKESVSSTDKYYSGFELLYNNLSLFKISTTDAPYGLDSKDLVFWLRDIMLERLSLQSDVQVYWEQYKNMYKRNTLIVVSSKSFSLVVKNENSTTNVSVTESTYTTYKDVGSSSSVPVRMVVHDLKDTININKYYKASHLSPVGFIENQYLQLQLDTERYIVSEIIFTFLRKPRRISLLLDQNCELHESSHVDICAKAVALMKKQAQSPAYNVELQEHQIKFN